MASRDYEEFIAAFNARGVRYLIVGAHAFALHAQPRATRDLDILIDPTPVNARFGSMPAHYLGLEQLLSTKAAARRPQDLADLRVLERARAARKRRAARNLRKRVAKRR